MICTPAIHILLIESNSQTLTVGLQDTEDLVTSDALDLGDAVRITQDNTNLGGGHALLGELEDLLADLLWGGLEP
ncbi:hypothetical protein BC936DRAFT_139101 [Jimgerdemannia flammicorona]|uniref:Uncharacterized protein n=1 Tax=Jimgerdemannia flammicorona TaxID=994334 RepID=A0A433BAP2_9FUNG|nr:hypothetical protein BC936DRAFT_139101 [Jimgerdemannia flammicorona]